MHPSDAIHRIIYQTDDLNLAAALLCCDRFELEGSEKDGGFVTFRIEGDGRELEAFCRCYERREMEVNVHAFCDNLNHLRKLIRSARAIEPHYKTRKENTDNGREQQRHVA